MECSLIFFDHWYNQAKSYFERWFNTRIRSTNLSAMLGSKDFRIIYKYHQSQQVQHPNIRQRWLQSINDDLFNRVSGASLYSVIKELMATFCISSNSSFTSNVSQACQTDVCIWWYCMNGNHDKFTKPIPYLTIQTWSNTTRARVKLSLKMYFGIFWSNSVLLLGYKAFGDLVLPAQSS